MKKWTKVMIVSASTSLLITIGLIVRDVEMGSNLIRGMHAEAATISYYKTTANLHMRTGASTKKSIIITIPKGKQVTYLSKSGSWFKVKYGSKTGYVSSSYLKKVQVGSTTPSATKTIYTTTSNLNLRSTPSTKGRVLLTIPKGKEVSYITKSGSWFKVKYQSKTGFVSSKYIKKTTKKALTPTTSVKTTKITPTTFQTKANLHMRLSASAKGKLLLTIPKDKKLIAKEKSGDWYKVSYNGRTGWVNAGYLKEYDRYSTTAVTYYSTRKSTGIYDNPNVKKRQKYTLPKDYSLTSTQKVVNSTGQTWYRVIYKKKNYFILSSDVTHKKASSMKKASFKSTQGTNLYSSAGTAHSKLASIAKGTIITASYRIGDWYEITHDGKKGYVMSKHFEEYKPTVSEMRPEGQATNESIYYVISDKPLHLQKSNSTSSAVLDEIPTQTAVKSVYKTKNGWFEVTYKDKKGYVSGQYLITKAEYDRYKTLVSTKNSYLTLDLRTQSSVTAAQIDRYIDGYVKRTGRESVLANKGQAIVNAGKEYGVNALYLAAHAVHESGYGTSAISLAKKNLFGFGAYDVAPFVGAVRFSSIEENINYIAREIKATYLTEGNWKHKGPTLGFTIKNVNGARVDSLSTGMNFYYASDSGWGAKITSHMNNILAYSNEKAVSRTPNTKSVSAPARPNGKDEFPSGILATAKTSIKLYAVKGSTKTSAVTIKNGETFYLLEKWNDNWLKIQYKGKVYYTIVISLSSYHHFMTVYNLAHITTNTLNVRSNAGTSYSKIGTLSGYTYVKLMLNNENKAITKNGWYQVELSTGKTGWISGVYIARDLNK